ncbi:hypothetical protein V6C53_01200 [Desulfocurvibacter africanus]|uniref:hypothetical protein n=1 Tax=Desulfocurvibacter africanus TaxID=873 RepID=UPI002FDA7B48
MKVAFTICSNNYLAQAKTMCDSLLSHNGDYVTVICLCDTFHPKIDYSSFAPHKVIEAASLNIPCFENMASRYGIIELNTSIKPYAFSYLFDNYPDAGIVLYFDPDIGITAPLKPIEADLEHASILLTPHILFPMDFDGLEPTENLFTQYGVFNLGFLGLKRGKDACELLRWWEKRMENNCYIRLSEGIFVDQLPMNYAPIFFDNVLIAKNPGYNVAPWNLHERRISGSNGSYRVNGNWPLIFYHFSSFKAHNHISNPAQAYSRGVIQKDSAAYELYERYSETVQANGYEMLSRIPYSLTKKEATVPLKQKIRSLASRLLS